MILTFPNALSRHVVKERSSGWIVLDQHEGVVTICRDREHAEAMAADRRVEEGYERLLRVILEA
jgi:hypothetical protein